MAQIMEKALNFLDPNRLNKKKIGDALEYTQQNLAHSINHTNKIGVRYRKHVLEQIKETQEEIEQLQALKENVNEEIANYENIIKNIEERKSKAREDIEITKKKLEQSKKEISKNEKEIEKQNKQREKMLKELEDIFGELTKKGIKQIYDSLFERNDTLEVSVVTALVGLLKNVQEPFENDIEIHFRNWDGIEYKMTFFIPENVSATTMEFFSPKIQENKAQLQPKATGGKSKYWTHLILTRWSEKAIEVIKFCLELSELKNQIDREANTMPETQELQKHFDSELLSLDKRLRNLQKEIGKSKDNANALEATLAAKRKYLEDLEFHQNKYPNDFFSDLQDDMIEYVDKIKEFSQ